MGNIQQYDFGDIEFVTTIRTSRPYADVEAIVKRILIDHGATIEESEQHWTVHFPEGTRRIEIWPRADSTRFRITFPDRYQIYETVTRYGISTLRYPSDEFPQAILQKYGYANPP
ncbi:hypothetical protein KDH_12340 [Dictyobacter sp. S3.2.2.5]|uniref:Uncharacterized protein n=1 Tax=Dictyobacter halimunensis TaxID=3026934 RepID=A0ABQ6FL18_9CHLR|nr:hypothetical protein KDH_12340 [Dictyobacter sp. S3.2.2.5]